MRGSSEFGNYHVQSALETRACLRAYRAVDNTDGSPVTLLVYRDSASGDPCNEYYERELLIRRRLADLPGVELVLHEGRTKQGIPFVVVPNRTPGDIESLMASRRISVGEAVALTVSIGETVAAANERGVVLMAIDPASVSLDTPNVLQDLSAATPIDSEEKRARESRAPEIRRGEAPTPLVDVWVLGAFLNRLLRRGDSGSPHGLAGDARLPEKLIDAVTRAMSFEPVDRQPSVDAFCTAIAEAMNIEEVDLPGVERHAEVGSGDDSTVRANEDLIRDLRSRSVSPTQEAATPDDDPTVVANEDLIRQIRDANALPQPSSREVEQDATVMASEDLVRQIRVAATGVSQPPSAEHVNDRIDVDKGSLRDVRAAPANVDAIEPEDDATVVASEDLVRQLRVATVAPLLGEKNNVGNQRGVPVQVPVQPDANPAASPDVVLREFTSPSEPDMPSPSLADLRRRFSPHVQEKKSKILPMWVLILGIGALGLLVVAILAVVLVG